MNYFYVRKSTLKWGSSMSRLRRRTCVTTKNIHELRRHLWLYVAHDPFFDAVKFKSIKDSVGLLSNQLLKAA